MERKLICRKCNGNHLTIKCDEINNQNIQVKHKQTYKELLASNLKITNLKTDNLETNNLETDNLETNNFKTNNFKTYNLKTDNFETYNFKNKLRKQIYRVKIDNLPIDISDPELLELTHDWGNILKLKVLNYNDNSVAYIDFQYEDQANYFIKALHKTSFDSLILCVTHAESY